MNRIDYKGEGFLTVLLAALIIGLVEGLARGEAPPLAQVPTWEATDSVPARGYLAYGTDSALHSEDHWAYVGPPPEPDTPASPLARFFLALERLHKGPGKVRIGYFGDSMIEGDLVTESLRNDLQERFGGAGVGFVPITSQTHRFRKSISHDFSSDWQDFSFLQPNPTDHDFGISGEFFLTRRPGSVGRTWVRYEGAEAYTRTGVFPQVKLYYGRREQGGSSPQAYVVVETATGLDTLALRGQGLVNELTISREQTDALKAAFSIPQDLPVFGCSFEADTGIYVDNFSARGNSGMNLIEIPAPTLREFQGHMDYDLIVLHYGLNVVSPGRRSFRTYEDGMKRVIDHFRTCMPQADILLISVSDKSTRIDGQMQTDPSVPLIVAAQRRVAEEKGVAFLDLYRGMGGHNAMVRWVANDLARKDYTHPNRKGADRIAGIVRSYLLDGYGEFIDARTGMRLSARR